MTIEDRREREKQKMKELILQNAARIIVEEGYEKLSIRKIASRIEYSPAIIYHYFSNKNEILSQVMKQGYQNLLTAISDDKAVSAEPGSRLKTMTRNYISSALDNSREFMAIQLNDSQEVLEFTSYLFENAAEEKTALKLLSQAVRELAGESVSDRDIELTSQIIAASTLGVVTRLILEKNIGEKQRNKIIDRFTEAIVRMASVSK